jgi:hypothetical protein
MATATGAAVGTDEVAGCEEWIDTLMADARACGKATVAGISETADGVAEATGLVVRLAGVLTALAGTVAKSHKSATETAAAVTAADWFWRQSRKLAVGRRKMVAGSACGVMVLLFGVSGPKAKGDDDVMAMRATAATPADWLVIAEHWRELVAVRPTPTRVDQWVECLIQAGDIDRAERVVNQFAAELGERQRWWHRARIEQCRGNATAADWCLWKAAVGESVRG